MTKVISLRKRKFYKPHIPKKTINRSRISNSDITKAFFLLIIILSVLSGCLFYKSYENDFITNVCKDFLGNLQQNSFIEVFKFSCKFDLIFFIAIFFLGTSFIGIPLTAIPIIIKGAFIGFFSSFVYCEYGLKGILFLLVLLYPMVIITTTSQIYSANESVCMSRKIMNVLTNKNTADDISIKLYIIRYSILMGINLITILVNSLLLVTVGTKFNLQ